MGFLARQRPPLAEEPSVHPRVKKRPAPSDILPCLGVVSMSDGSAIEWTAAMHVGAVIFDGWVRRCAYRGSLGVWWVGGPLGDQQRPRGRRWVRVGPP